MAELHIDDAPSAFPHAHDPRFWPAPETGARLMLKQALKDVRSSAIQKPSRRKGVDGGRKNH
jgi:hypothetical protein